MFNDHYDKMFAVVIDLTVFYGQWSMAICAKYTIALTASSNSPYSPVFITLSFYVHPILFQSDSIQSETAAIRNCFNPDWFQFWNINLPSILLLLCNSVWFAHRVKEEWLAKCVESILIKMLWSLGRIKYSWWLMIFLYRIELSRLQCFYSLIFQAPDQTNRLKSNTWIDLTMVGVVELHVIQNTISNRYENHIRLFK